MCARKSKQQHSQPTHNVSSWSRAESASKPAPSQDSTWLASSIRTLTTCPAAPQATPVHWHTSGCASLHPALSYCAVLLCIACCQDAPAAALKARSAAPVVVQREVQVGVGAVAGPALPLQRAEAWHKPCPTHAHPPVLHPAPLWQAPLDTATQEGLTFKGQAQPNGLGLPIIILCTLGASSLSCASIVQRNQVHGALLRSCCVVVERQGRESRRSVRCAALVLHADRMISALATQRCWGGAQGRPCPAGVPQPRRAVHWTHQRRHVVLMRTAEETVQPEAAPTGASGKGDGPV